MKLGELKGKWEAGPGSPVAHIFSAGVMNLHYDEDMLEV